MIDVAAPRGSRSELWQIRRRNRLKTASRTGKLDAVKTLIDRGTAVMRRSVATDGLDVGVLRDHPDVVIKFLLARGADVNAHESRCCLTE